jgi:hypothetical protein
MLRRRLVNKEIYYYVPVLTRKQGNLLYVPVLTRKQGLLQCASTYRVLVHNRLTRILDNRIRSDGISLSSKPSQRPPTTPRVLYPSQHLPPFVANIFTVGAGTIDYFHNSRG